MSGPARPDGYRPVLVKITTVAALGVVAIQQAALYPGCDVVLTLDRLLKLRGASIRDQATVYALAVEHSRHGARSVHVTGAGVVLREEVARLIATAHPGCEVTYATVRNEASGPRAAPSVPPATVVGRSP